MPELQTSLGPLRAILFDLDGTFLDTAPDLAGAINRMRAAREMPALPLETLAPFASQGARGLVGTGFGLSPDHPDYAPLRDEFFALYAQHLCEQTRPFEGIEQLVTLLADHGVQWGIVTNKSARFTTPLVERMPLLQGARVVVSGDTASQPKPHPAPFLHAALVLGIAPQHCLAVGDDERDIISGRSAGMRTAAAAWGYCGGGDPAQWGADLVFEHPHELARFLTEAG